MITNPTPQSQEAMKNRHMTIPPHEDQGGGTDHGIPAGGTTGQLLAKKSNTDYDAEWTSVPQELPPHGITGQVLTKKSMEEGDVEWALVPKEMYVRPLDEATINGVNPYLGERTADVSPGNPGRYYTDASIADLPDWLPLPYGTKAVALSTSQDHAAYWTVSSIELHNTYCANGILTIKAKPFVEMEFYSAADREHPDPANDELIENTIIYADTEEYNIAEAALPEVNLSLGIETYIPINNCQHPFFTGLDFYIDPEEYSREDMYVYIKRGVELELENVFPEDTSITGMYATLEGEVSYPEAAEGTTGTNYYDTFYLAKYTQ